MRSPILAIWKKDMKAFLTSPMFYTLVGICACLWGILFTYEMVLFVKRSFEMSKASQIGLNHYHHFLAPYSVVVHYILIFILSALSIRYFAEEKKLGSFSIYLMNPLTSWQVVLGKWLVGLTVLATLLLVSLIFPLSLLFFSSLPLKLLLYGYLGLFLVLTVYMTAGLLASSLTESLIVCVVLNLVFIFIFLLLGAGKNLFEAYWLQNFFEYLAFDAHYLNFRKGVFSLGSIVYYLSWSAFLLVVTERMIESNRWK